MADRTRLMGTVSSVRSTKEPDATSAVNSSIRPTYEETTIVTGNSGTGEEKAGYQALGRSSGAHAHHASVPPLEIQTLK